MTTSTSTECRAFGLVSNAHTTLLANTLRGLCTKYNKLQVYEVVLSVPGKNTRVKMLKKIKRDNTHKNPFQDKLPDRQDRGGMQHACMYACEIAAPCARMHAGGAWCGRAMQTGALPTASSQRRCARYVSPTASATTRPPSGKPSESALSMTWSRTATSTSATTIPLRSG